MSSYKGGYIALELAALRGNHEVAKVLVDAGADVNIQDNVSTHIGFI